jgi:hypothetical protein
VLLMMLSFGYGSCKTDPDSDLANDGRCNCRQEVCLWKPNPPRRGIRLFAAPLMRQQL